MSLDASDAFIDARTKLRDQLSKAARDRVVAEQLQKAKAEAESQRAALRLAMLEKLAGEEVIIERHSRRSLSAVRRGPVPKWAASAGRRISVGESLFVVGGAVGALLTSYNVSQLNQAGQSSAANEYSTRARVAALYGNFAQIGGSLGARRSRARRDCVCASARRNPQARNSYALAGALP